LRVDPTRTITLRKSFIREFSRRFNRLKAEIKALVDTEDAFGLRQRNHFLNEASTVTNRRFEFQTTSQQVQSFEQWLARRSDGIILEAGQAEGYWNQYIQEGYRKGAGRSFNDVRKPYAQGYAQTGGDVSGFFAGTRAEFLRQSFANPESVDKIKLLAGRTFTDLKGVTQSMATQLSRELTQGLSQGDNPKVIARRLAKTVDGIGKVRAKAIAQTEIIRAHAEGQLDSLEALGLTKVTVMAELSTAGDDRVCPQCIPLDGMVLTIKEARGLIPVHVSCRCSWIPANVGEEAGDRSQKSVQEAIDQSVASTLPKGRIIKDRKVDGKLVKGGRRFKHPVSGQFTKKKNRTLEEQKALSTWPGATRKVAKVRPKPFDVTPAKVPVKPTPAVPTVKKPPAVVEPVKVATPEAQLSSAIAKTEKDILAINPRKETAVVFDASGNVLVKTTGTVNKAKFTSDEVAHFKGNVLTHSHPNVIAHGGKYVITDVPFSGQDGYMLAKHGMKEIRAVSQDATYTMTPKPGATLDADFIRGVFESKVKFAERQLAGTLMIDLRAGTITEEVAGSKMFLQQTAIQRAVWEEVADDFGLVYKRIPNG